MIAKPVSIKEEFANRLESDNALDRVSAVARASVQPHVAAALELAGYRLCMDTLAIGGADDLAITLERLKRDLAASACSCGGSGEIIKAGYHPGDPAAAEACPECRGGERL